MYKKEKPAGEQLHADFDSPRDDSHQTCAEKFERIERELAVVLRAIWACGVLQGKKRTAVDVDDGRVDRLVRELGEAK